ncbi:type II secretion system F family protein, partial [bacterium]|nr:type II secretion system F family protein [bacterium]
RTDISRGASITAALEKYPQAFDQLYISMVKAGEIGGVLDEVLQRLADQLEKLAELRRKIKGAMVYPAVVIVFSGGIVAFLLTFVIPVFATMFEGFGSELPAATRMLIFASDILKNQFLYVLVITIVSIVAFRLWVRTPAGELIYDTYLLKLPVFGSLFRKVAIAKFSRTLGALVRSGVPILEALEIVARGSGNKLVENAVMDARSAIRGGERISDPLGKSRIFPPMVIQMISVGEESGTLDSMLNKIADFYDSEVDAAVAALASAIEPVIIVVLGVIVLFVMIALFMPLFDIAGTIE